MGNILYGFAAVFDMLLTMYQWVVIIRAVISFVSPDPHNPIVRILSQLTDPVFYWLRRRIPLVYGGLDFSPLVVLAAILFLKFALVQNLLKAAQSMGGGM